VKVPKSKSDDYVPDDSKIIEAYNKLEDERYKIMFKLLAFSGIRLREAIYLFNNFDKNKLIFGEMITKYPLSLDIKSKKSFYAYMPKSFAMELKKIELSEEAVKQYFSRRGLPAKYLRKWNYNF